MSVVYVDLVGDLFHAGHVSLLRSARELGDRLVVGVLGDDDVASYKRRPVMTLDERVTVVAACRYVDEVVAPAPMRLSDDFVVSYGITTVVHGDDLTDQAAADVYGRRGVASLVLVPRTTSLSTTAVIERVLSRGMTS